MAEANLATDYTDCLWDLCNLWLKMSRYERLKLEELAAHRVQQ
jgi:hypothetical protein